MTAVSGRIEILETLRDAWQGLDRIIPTQAKVAHIQRLVDAGFPRIDIGSFVSPTRVPAMADTDELLQGVQRAEGVIFTGLVANERGLDRLLAVPQIGEVLYPFSLSETFSKRNLGVGRDEAFALLRGLAERVYDEGRALYVTISMAFGNHEGDPWSPAEVRVWVERLYRAGVTRVGLADTVARATPAIIGEVYEAVMQGARWPVPAAHLHVTPQNQEALVDATLAAGCRAFDAALGGLGGCQFATGAVSNVSTRSLARQVAAHDLDPVLPLVLLDELDAAALALAEG